MSSRRPVIVIAATPTPNGDLHVGHLAGPYLAADVCARYLRATGRQVSYSTCTDDSQSYVLTTAAKQGSRPAALCANSTAAIAKSLSAMGISIAELPPIDDRYRHCVLDFMQRLYDTGRLRTRSVRLPYAEDAGIFLYDGLVTGRCPACSARSCGGVCEECGHPNNYDELRDPSYTIDPAQPVSWRPHPVLVLPMEDYREQLTSYFATRGANWRPRARQLIRELLAGRLPEIPITMPGRWGIPAPFAPTPGQVFYPWVEAMPASMYSTWWANRSTPGHPDQTDGYWLAERAAQPIYFHGFDNTYHWGLMDLTLLMAHGDRYVLPEVNVCNEFYELEGEKFSTSRNHLIRGSELLAELPRDLIRFYLAMTSPEQRRTNFTRRAMHEITRQRLVAPWNALADELSLLVAGRTGGTLASTPGGRARANELAHRIGQCYQPETFSLARAAEALAGELVRLATAAGGRLGLGDLLLLTRTLLACAAPILIDVSEQAAAAGVPLGLDQPAAEAVAVFELPRLPEFGELVGIGHRAGSGEPTPLLQRAI